MSEKRVRTDIDGLSKLIDLPGTVTGARWEHRASQGGSSLAAVMYLDRGELEALIAKSRLLDRQLPTTIDAATAGLLFPETARPSPGAELEIRGVTIHPGRLTNKNKSGLLNGKAVVQMDRGFVFVSLYEM